MEYPGAHNVRRRPQGLGVARDVSAPRIGDLSVRRTPGVSRWRIPYREDRKSPSEDARTSGASSAMW
jgi:hypothetical protein